MTKINKIISDLSHQKPEKRIEAIKSLEKFKISDAFEPLLNLLDDKNMEVQKHAMIYLPHIDTKRSISPLMKLLRSDNRITRITAWAVLEPINDSLVKESLVGKLKIVALGPVQSGKTSLYKNISLGGDDPIASMINIDRAIIEFLPDKWVWLNNYDFLGKPNYLKFSIKTLLKDVSGIILAFDLSKPETFDVIDGWLENIHSFVKDVPFILVGNKLDLISEKEKSSEFDKYKEWAEKNNTEFFAVSAINGTNVNEAFSSLTQKIVANK